MEHAYKQKWFEFPPDPSVVEDLKAAVRGVEEFLEAMLEKSENNGPPSKALRIFQSALQKAVSGESAWIPYDAEGWGLTGHDDLDDDDIEPIVDTLERRATTAVLLAAFAPLEERDSIRAWVSEYTGMRRRGRPSLN